MSLEVTFVRHGESMDNLKTIWAGWKDAPLSNHGHNQAKACGAYFAAQSYTFHAIYASPLKRAHTTAQEILAAQPSPSPSFTVNPDLREQHFGEAEGHSWSFKGEADLSREEMYARGIYPVIHNREDRFPGGESSDDLKARAERAIEEIVIPHVHNVANCGENERIALVSHGLCISELVAALMRKDDRADARAHGRHWTGLQNTAWTKVRVTPMVMDDATEPNLPPLRVEVTHVNVHTHLDSVKRQHGGIGSAAHDPAQKDIRAFFGGGGSPSSSTAEATQTSSGGKAETAIELDLEEGRAASNAYDEVGLDDCEAKESKM